MTLVGKAKLDHPALGTAGGSGLHAAIENLWEKVSDHLPARWHLFESVSNSATVTFDHGFEVPFADLRVHLYLKGESSNTKVEDPGADGWSIVATSGFAQSKLDVTAPSSGGPFDFYLYVSHEPVNDKLNLSGGTMTGTLILSGDPSQDLHAATKRYVDAVAQGLDPKGSVKVATTADIGLSGPMTIDGVAVVAGDRVLVKDQSTASQNGIYVVAAGAWSRASDMDSWAEVPGAFVFVEQGTANADKGYVCTADQGGTIGTTAVTWVQFAGVGTYTAGNAGISIAGTAISLATDGSTLEVGGSGAQIKDLGVTSDKLAGSIPDSKLSKLSTAGKVSGDAITDGTIGGSTAITTTGTPTFNGTSHLKIPAGTVAQRPGTPANGMIRYNSDQGAFEGYASGAWSGIGGGGTVDKVTQNAHGFAIGDVLYINLSGVYVKALASAANTAEVVGMVSRVVDVNNFEITLNGEVSGLSGLTVGEVYFLSPSSQGGITITEPSTVGHVSLPIGVASSASTLYVAPKRGIVVGGANARTQVSLLNNSINQQVQDVNAYEAGELAGWVYIDASTDLRFYIQAQFVKGGDNIYDMSYQVSGDTPPAGFLMLIDSGIIRITMPNIAGYSAGYINFALNAPAVGTNFPLTVDGANVTAASASTPGVVSLSNQSLGAGDKYFSGNVGVGTTSPQTQFELFSSGDPICGFYRNNSGVNVGLGRVRWDGLNASSTRVNYGYLQMGIQSNTAGSHGGYYDFVTTFNGSASAKMRLTAEGYLAVGSPTILSPIAAASVNDSVLSLQHKNSTVNGGRIEYFDQNGTRRVYMGGTSNSSSNFQITVHESGGVVLAPGATSWSAAVSDERKKKDFETSQGLAEVLKIEPIKYRFDTEDDSAPKRLGFKAQNLLPLIPEMVLPTGEKAEDGSDYLTITPDYLLPVLVKAIQELKAELDAVKSELASLK